MFGRKKKQVVPTTARAALRDTRFPSTLPGLAALLVDYDPAVWMRLPHEGEDRTLWVERYLDAYATDYGLSANSDHYSIVSEALNLAVDPLLTHTCDLVAVDAPRLGNAVGYLNLVDEELGMLEHASPEVYLTMADVRPEGPPALVRWHSIGSVRKAYRLSFSSFVDLDQGRDQRLTRAVRDVSMAGDQSALIYGTIFHFRLGGAAQLVRLMSYTEAEATDGSVR